VCIESDVCVASLELIFLEYSNDTKFSKDVFITNIHFDLGRMAESNVVLSFKLRLDLSKSCLFRRIRNASDFFLSVFLACLGADFTEINGALGVAKCMREKLGSDLSV